VLGRRSIEPGYGLWCLPGGFVNHDEDPAGAAVRECMEEINARVDLTGLIGVYHVAKTTTSSMVGIAYRGRLSEGAAITAGPEMLEVRVFPLDGLPPIAFPSHQAVLAAYLRSPELVVGPEPLTAAAGARPASPPSPRPAAPGAVDDSPGHRSRACVENGLQPEKQANLEAGKPEALSGKDRDEGAERSPDEGHADEPDRDGHKSRLPCQRPKRFAQREPLARVLARLARRQGAGDGEDQKRRRHGDVSPQVDPLESETGDSRPKREADLHR